MVSHSLLTLGHQEVTSLEGTTGGMQPLVAPLATKRL